MPTSQSFVIVGAGFFAGYQLAAWRELPGKRCIAVCDPDAAKAQALAATVPGAAAFTDLQTAIEALGVEAIGFVDIITPPSTHREVAELALRAGIPTISQKPLAGNLDDARHMRDVSAEVGVPLVVHENWRWQRQIRAVRELLDVEAAAPFRARIQFNSSFPVFEKQPSLRLDERFLLLDVGPHILDIARFLFGEPQTVYARTAQVNEGIAGEDVATVVLGYAGGLTVTCEMSYASRIRDDLFPQTFISVETAAGAIELGPDFEISITDRSGTRTEQHPPQRYAWSAEPWELIQDSIVLCNSHLAEALAANRPAETTADDNLKTLGLVFDSYRSAELGQPVDVGSASTATAPR